MKKRARRKAGNVKSPSNFSLDLNCDAIIMGTHGKGIISHTFFGNTAKRVLRRTRKPVFIIPLPKGETDITFNDE